MFIKMIEDRLIPKDQILKYCGNEPEEYDFTEGKTKESSWREYMKSLEPVQKH